MRPMDYETYDFVSAELGFCFLTEFVMIFFPSMLLFFHEDLNIVLSLSVLLPQPRSEAHTLSRAILYCIMLNDIRRRLEIKNA